MQIIEFADGQFPRVLERLEDHVDGRMLWRYAALTLWCDPVGDGPEDGARNGRS